MIEIIMLEGKCINAITNTNDSRSCNVCKAKPSQMNHLELVRSRIPDEEALRLGISCLHCYIRVLDYLLHVAYKLPLRKYVVSTDADKAIVKATKQRIQNECRERLSLVIDMPKQGFGTSNTGNTARRVLENAEEFADITGLDVEVIVRLRTILKAICSGIHPQASGT